LATIEQLRALLEGASAQRPHLTSRLEKAAFLVLLRPIRQVGQDIWLVGSEDGLRYYRVVEGECECTDYTRHGQGHPCKHRLALFLYRNMMDVRAESAPGLTAAPSRASAAAPIPRGFRR
jgi:SWIM zinc finger.